MGHAQRGKLTNKKNLHRMNHQPNLICSINYWLQAPHRVSGISISIHFLQITQNGPRMAPGQKLLHRWCARSNGQSRRYHWWNGRTGVSSFKIFPQRGPSKRILFSSSFFPRFASAVAMARKGAHVIVTARSDKRGQGAIEKIKQESGSEKVEYGVMENADLGSVCWLRIFLSSLIDKRTLFFSFCVPGPEVCRNIHRQKTPYPHPFTQRRRRLRPIQSNIHRNRINLFRQPCRSVSCSLSRSSHARNPNIISPPSHYLTTLLLPTLTSQQFPSRIVVLSSKAAEWSSWSRPNWDQTAHVTKEQYSTVTAYHLSKLANALFTRELTKRVRFAWHYVLSNTNRVLTL